MSKKITTLLLLAVFVLAQFSVASAARLATGDATLATSAVFSAVSAGSTIDLDWTATGLPAGTKSVSIWSRIQDLTTPVAYSGCQDVATILGTSDASGTFAYDMTVTGATNAQVVEFIVVLDSDDCTLAVAPIATDDAQASTTVDDQLIQGIYAIPPYKGAALFGVQPVSCNTFENWAIAQDNRGLAPTDGYAGFGAWNQSTSGTFAAPAPEGPASELLAWNYTFPATASGDWSFTINPEDAAGNIYDGTAPIVPLAFRDVLAIDAAELADCKEFDDVAGDANELYIRYLADLGLIAGTTATTFSPTATLSRAEAAALFAKANGWTEASVGFGTAPVAGSACDFSDVAKADWFSGWVWKACEWGFMNGVGGGMFDPNNTLTRGQVVTIFNNVSGVVPVANTFLGSGNVINWPGWGFAAPYRTAAFTDVFVGAYYAAPVQIAYGLGVAEGTSATTFGPDEPATRSDFAKMLYRALSNVSFY